MRVRVSNTSLLPDLVEYLRGCDCLAEPTSPTELDVSIPALPSERGALAELRVYLTAWRIRHEGAEAEIIE